MNRRHGNITIATVAAILVGAILAAFVVNFGVTGFARIKSQSEADAAALNGTPLTTDSEITINPSSGAATTKFRYQTTEQAEYYESTAAVGWSPAVSVVPGRIDMVTQPTAWLSAGVTPAQWRSPKISGAKAIGPGVAYVGKSVVLEGDAGDDLTGVIAIYEQVPQERFAETHPELTYQDVFVIVGFGFVQNGVPTVGRASRNALTTICCPVSKRDVLDDVHFGCSRTALLQDTPLLQAKRLMKN